MPNIVAVKPEDVRRVIRGVAYVGVAWAETKEAAKQEALRLRRVGLRSRSVVVPGSPYDTVAERYAVCLPEAMTHQEQTIWDGERRRLDAVSKR